MKTSEAIKHLLDSISEHGDLPLKQSSGGSPPLDVTMIKHDPVYGFVYFDVDAASPVPCITGPLENKPYWTQLVS